MAIGVVGNIRPSDVNVEDIDVFYSYTTDRTVVPNNIVKLSSEDLISTINYENTLLTGLYNINLPSSNFNETGIYNVYIKPKEIKLKISDCGVLSSQPNVKGIIIDINQYPELQTRANSNDLAGFRIEYFDNSGNKIRNIFKIITSSNRCIPENNNNTNNNESITRYRFTENTISNLLFLTITPSNPTSVRPNIDPFFGVPNQDIIITNTFFKPVLLELEIVEHDEQTLAIGIFGNQTKTRKDGIITYYGPNNEIYKQYDSFAIEDESIDERVEVKKERTEIDITKNFEDLTNI